MGCGASTSAQSNEPSPFSGKLAFDNPSQSTTQQIHPQAQAPAQPQAIDDRFANFKPYNGRVEEVPQPQVQQQVQQQYTAQTVSREQNLPQSFSQGESRKEGQFRSEGESRGEAKAPQFRSEGESREENKAPQARSEGESRGESKAPQARSEGESRGESKAPQARSEGESKRRTEGESRGEEKSYGESREGKPSNFRSEGEGRREGQFRSEGESRGEGKAKAAESEVVKEPPKEPTHGVEFYVYSKSPRKVSVSVSPSAAKGHEKQVEELIKKYNKNLVSLSITFNGTEKGNYDYFITDLLKTSAYTSIDIRIQSMKMFTNEALKKCGEIIEKMPLQRFSFIDGGPYGTDDMIFALAPSIKNCHALTYLCLQFGQCRLATDESLVEIKEAIEGLQNLEEVYFIFGSSENISDYGVGFLKEGLRSKPALKSLRLSFELKTLTDISLTHLTELVHSLPQLKELAITGAGYQYTNHFSKKGVEDFTAMANSLPIQSYLTLGTGVEELTPEQIKAGELPKKNFYGVTFRCYRSEPRIVHVTVAPEKAKGHEAEIEEYIKTYSHGLSSISIEFGRPRHGNMDYFITDIFRTSSYKEVEIAFRSLSVVSEQGLQGFSDVIGTSSFIKCNISNKGSDTTDEFFATLSPGIQKSTSLKDLRLVSRNAPQMTNQAYAYIKDAVAGSRSIESLYLLFGGTKHINDQAIVHLKDALKGKPHMKDIVLCFYDMDTLTDTALDHIIDTLKPHKGLDMVMIECTQNQFTEKGKSKFKAAIKTIPIRMGADILFDKKTKLENTA